MKAFCFSSAYSKGIIVLLFYSKILPLLSSLRERDIFILKYAFKMNAMYLLRKCDIISRCGIAIHSWNEIYFVPRMWWKARKFFARGRKRDIHFVKHAFQKVKVIYLLCKCDIISRCEIAIYSPLANVVESTLHINPHAAQFAAYRAFEYLACGEVCKSISQIREDLYRFILFRLLPINFSAPNRCCICFFGKCNLAIFLFVYRVRQTEY